MQFTRGDKKVKRCFDKLPKASLRPGDVEPMYTSFKPSGIFRQQSTEIQTVKQEER